MAEILRMPEVAAGAVEAVLSSWVAVPGQHFSAGDVVMTVETDKAVVDVEAESDGVLLRALVEAGATVEVGSPIAVYGVDGESAADADALLESLGAAPDLSPRAVSTPEDLQSDVAESEPDEARLFASPLARRLAREAGLALRDVEGTGPRGRIRRRDIEAALSDRVLPEVEMSLGKAPTASGPPAANGSRVSSSAASPETAGRGHEDLPNSRLRQAIARRLTESKQATPHFYLRCSARVERLLSLREEINAGGNRVSLNDLVVKAVGRAHRLVPAMNVEWRGEGIRRFHYVDVAVAVAIDDGLVTPVVRDADTLDIVGLSRATRDIADRARERRLQQHELEGGSISVTNLGMYGVEDFAAIINPPQAAILAVGAAREEALVSDGQVTAGMVMRLCLAADHRPVDGATAAKWLNALVHLLENPVELLI